MTSRRGIARFRAANRRCRDIWRECTLPTLNALSGPASAQLGFFLAEVFEGVDRLLLVWLNARPRTSASVSERFWISCLRGKCTRPPKTNNTRPVTKASQVSRGSLGEAPRCLLVSLQALAVSRPRGAKRAARPVLHTAAISGPSDHATNLDARESHSKPRERPIFSSPHFKLFGADSRAERTRRARRGTHRFISCVKKRPARCESESHTKRSVSDLVRSNQVDPWCAT